MKKYFGILVIILESLIIDMPITQAKNINENTCVMDIPNIITNIICKSDKNKKLFFDMQLYKAKLQNKQIDSYNIIKISEDYNNFIDNLNICFKKKDYSENCIISELEEKTNYYKKILFANGGNDKN